MPFRDFLDFYMGSLNSGALGLEMNLFIVDTYYYRTGFCEVAPRSGDWSIGSSGDDETVQCLELTFSSGEMLVFSSAI